MSVQLSEKLEFKVRFNEADPLGIVWHGHYLSYFEDGREAFGEKYGLRYLDIYKQGYTAPVVSINCNYKKSLQYGDTAVVETIYINNPASKINFQYKIYNPTTLQLIAEGSSMQVFLDRNTMQLQLSTPEFFETWKKNQGLFNA